MTNHLRSHVALVVAQWFAGRLPADVADGLDRWADGWAGPDLPDVLVYTPATRQLRACTYDQLWDATTGGPACVAVDLAGALQDVLAVDARSLLDWDWYQGYLADKHPLPEPQMRATQ